MLVLHLGHFTIDLQLLHITELLKPLLPKNKITFLFFSNSIFIDFIRVLVSPSFGLSMDESMIVIIGSLDLKYLFSSLYSWYLFIFMFRAVSKDGVALPRITGHLKLWPLNIPMSRALYLNFSVCLYEPSCSSSTTISPNFLKGKKNRRSCPYYNNFFSSVACFPDLMLLNRGQIRMIL